MLTRIHTFCMTILLAILVASVANVSSGPDQLCGNLHPEAKYMTPPDENGTMRWMPKDVADFVNFASCFNERYGANFAPEDFRPCNSIPGISEDDRFQCIFGERGNKARSNWCSDKFRRDHMHRKDIRILNQCWDEFNLMDGLSVSHYHAAD